jgi:hypothetical protein
MAAIRFLDDHGGTVGGSLASLRDHLARIASLDSSSDHWLCHDAQPSSGEEVFEVRIWLLADWREELRGRAPADRILAEFSQRVNQRARAVRPLEKSDEPCPECGSALEIAPSPMRSGPPARVIRCTNTRCAYGARVPRSGWMAGGDE